MPFAYSDIINLRRPAHVDDVFSRVHPRMPRLNRAKLFAPYAALRGFEDCVAAKRAVYEPRRVPDAMEARTLNRRIARLNRLCWNSRLARKSGVTARAVYFVPCADENHEAFGRGGQYVAVEGLVRRVDVTCRYLIVADTRIDFDDLWRIDLPDDAPAE